MKRIMHDCLCNGARLNAVRAYDKDAGVVIGHRQTPVVLGLGSFRERDRYRVSEARSQTCLWSRVDQCGGRILREQPQQCRLLYLHNTTERAPAGGPQLVSADVLISEFNQVIGKPLATAAKEAVAI